MQSWSLENVWSLETVEPHFVVRLTTIANLLSFLYRVGSHHQHCGKMSMALRNQLLGQKACLVESTFLPGKPRDTRAQRLAIRRSVMLWGARASYETISTSADSFTSGSSVLENLENVASKLWETNGSSGKEKRTLEFVKYEGLGNDFIMVNNLDSDSPIITPEEASRLCDRHLGIGGDGVIFVMKDKDRYNGIDDDYYQMRIYNSDGSEPEMCGNGVRCVGKYLAEITKAKAPKRYNVLTLGGNMILDIREDGQVCVDMGPPILNAPDVPTKLKAEGEVVKAPLEVDGKTWSVTCVSMGNPHCVTFGEHGGEELNVDSLPLEQIGPLFEHHEMFPARTNTEFVERISRTHLKMRVWERGAGATQACGTGACAVVVAAVKEGHSERNCVVDLPGGPLEIEWREADNHIYMTGPAKRVFHGLIHLEG